MRFPLVVGSCLLVASTALGQAALQPLERTDSGQSALSAQMAELDRKEAQLRLEERKLALEHREREIAFQHKALDEQYKLRMENIGKEQRGGPGRAMPFPIVRRLFALCVLACLTLHILLTVLVFGDMRARKDMNGLWIALVLIGGVLTTVIYALFRRGEGVKAA